MRTSELTEVEVLAEGLQFPEGPVALDDGSVLVVEIVGGNLTRVETDGSREVVAHLGGGPNGAAIGPDGAVYVCNNGGFGGGGKPSIQRVDLGTGEWEELYATSGGQPLAGPNDLVFDTTGGFWFTDYGARSIHYAIADGSSCDPKIKGLRSPNGIGLSPDGAVLYWAETTTRQVVRRHLEGAGRPAPSAGFGIESLVTGGEVDMSALVVGLPGAQELDSLAVDSSGAVCVGTLLESGITEVPPDGGLDAVTRWILPEFANDPVITNIAFGGDDLTTAFITCSLTGRLVRCRWHRPGLRLAFG